MCVEVRLVAEGLTEAEAHAVEIDRIAFWKASGVDLANLTAGGEGASNPALETRERMRAAKIGRKLSDEHKRKIGNASRATQATPEARAAKSAQMREILNRPDVKARMSEFQRTRARSKEQYKKTAAALTGRRLSAEHAEKARKASVGRKQSAEEIERRRTANLGRKRTPEFCAHMKAVWTPERRAAQSKRTSERNLAKKLASSRVLLSENN